MPAKKAWSKKTDHKKIVKLEKEVKEMTKGNRGYSNLSGAIAVAPLDTSTSFPTSVFATQFEAGLLAQGDNVNQRQGDTVSIQKWKVKYSVACSQGVTSSGTDNTSVKVRVIAFRMKQPNGQASNPAGSTAPIFGDLIDLQDGQGKYYYTDIMADIPAIRQKSNIHIIHDKIHDLTVNKFWGNTAVDKASMDRTHTLTEFSYYPKGNKSTISYSGTTGVAANVAEGPLYIVALGDYASTSSPQPVLQYNSHLEFDA